MNLNASRHLRALAIAAVPLFLIAGAAVASSSHPTVIADPTSGPAAESTDTVGAADSPIVEKTPDGTKAPEASESSEPSNTPEASDNDSTEDQDVDEGPGASAHATIGNQDGDNDGDNDGNKGQAPVTPKDPDRNIGAPGRPDASMSPGTPRDPDRNIGAPGQLVGFPGPVGGRD